MDDDPAGGGASLTSGADAAEQDAWDGDVEVGGFGDDHRVVSAELKEGASESGGDFLGDDSAHSRRTGCADQGNSVVIDHLGSGFGVAEDDLTETLGNLAEFVGGFLKNGLASEGDEGCFLGWLPEAAITADKGERSVPRPDRDWKVECRDDSDRP